MPKIVTTIAIVVPGTTGTSLVHYNALQGGVILAPVWPDQVLAEVVAQRFTSAEALLQIPGLKQDPTGEQNPLVPYGPRVGLSGNGGYEPLLSYLTQCLGVNGQLAAQYTWNLTHTQVPLAGTASAPANLVIGFGYDWREDNGWNATQLQALLSRIHDVYTAATHPYQIVLVAHSMGGLLSRAYLEGGLFDPRIAVKALITLGTPHLGAPLALDPLIGGVMFPALPDTVIDVLIDNVDFPSTYELLPPASHPTYAADGESPAGGFVNDVAEGNTVVGIYATPLPAPFYKTLTGASSAGFGASADNLTAAQVFASSLSGKPPSGVSYYAMYGLTNDVVIPKGQAGTITSYGWTSKQTAAGSVSAVYTPYSALNADGVPENIWTGGDGVVPVWSAMFAGNDAVTTAPVVNCSHLEMPANAQLHAQLGTWLTNIIGSATTPTARRDTERG